MSLQDDIFAWVRKAPPWTQELYLRAAVSPQLGPDDACAVTAMLLGDSATHRNHDWCPARISLAPTEPATRCASSRFPMSAV